MRITFRDLENFIHCAESKTLSEAAEKLQMAQPSLSLGIKKLEKEIGHPLFYRSKEGLKLTPYGKNLLPEVRSTLLGLNKIKGLPVVPKFKIGCHPSVGMFILGEFFKKIHKAMPDFDFEIVNASSHDINKLVAQGQVDFGLVMNPVSFKGLVIKTIGYDEVSVWESPNRYQNKLIYNPQMMQSLSIASRWKGAPMQTIDVANLELITKLVHSGVGYGIIPTQVVKEQKCSIRRVPNTPTFKDQLTLVCFPEMIRSTEGRKVFDVLKSSYQSES